MGLVEFVYKWHNALEGSSVMIYDLVLSTRNMDLTAKLQKFFYCVSLNILLVIKIYFFLT